MKYMTEFRDRGLALGLAKGIAALMEGRQRLTVMEVCGTHTMNVFKYGLKWLLPSNLRLLSGPGCPVCVTPASFIDKAIALAGLPEVIVTTFGDMFKVPGSTTSLEAAGLDNVKVVYSTLEALSMAEDNPSKNIVFLAVGFETTAPTIAASILEADRRRLDNYFVLCAHKTMPQVMRALVEDKAIGLQGFICPAHVSTIIGSGAYEFLARDFGIPCVIAGFEPLDILHGIYTLLRQIIKGEARVEIQYSRVTRPQGNPRAREVMEEVFEPCHTEWRGIGIVPGSGLKLRRRFERFDALHYFAIKIPEPSGPKGCLCGDILRGSKSPPGCRFFSKVCTPSHPIGPCMVSSEGTCAAWFKYGGDGYER